MEKNDPLQKLWTDGWVAVVRADRKTPFPDTIPGAYLDNHKKDPKKTVLVFRPKNEEAIISRKSGGLCFKTEYKDMRMGSDSSGIPVIHRISKVHRGIDPITGEVFVGLTTQAWRFAPVGYICMLYEAFKTEKKLNKFRIMDCTGKPIDIGTSLSHFKHAMTNSAKFEVPYSFASRFIAEAGGKFVHDPTAKSLLGLFYLQPTLYIQFTGDRLGIQMYPEGFHDKYVDLSDEDKQLVFNSRLLFIDKEKCDHFEKMTAEIQYTHRMIDCIECCYRKGSQCQYMTGGKCPSYKCCCLRECPYREDAFDDLLLEWTKIEEKLVVNPAVNSGIDKINDIFNNPENSTIELIKESLYKFIGKVLVNDLLDFIRPVQSMDELHVEFISAYFRKAALVAFESFTEKWQYHMHSSIFAEWRECIILGRKSDVFIRDTKVQFCRAMAYMRLERIFTQIANDWDMKHGNPIKHRLPLTEEEVKQSFLVKPEKPTSKKPKKPKKPISKKR